MECQHVPSLICRDYLFETLPGISFRDFYMRVNGCVGAFFIMDTTSRLFSLQAIRKNYGVSLHCPP